MLNNKGLVVSSVLYTLLIAFLLFLGVTLAQFSSSAKIISNSTKDLVNNTDLEGKQVTIQYSGKTCGVNYFWFERYPTDANGNPDTDASPIKSTTLARIYSRYGTTFWPRDFVLEDRNPKNGDSKTNKLHIDCFKTCIPDATNDCSAYKIDVCTFDNVKTAFDSGTTYVTIKVTDTAVTNSTHNFFINNKCN